MDPVDAPDLDPDPEHWFSYVSPTLVELTDGRVGEEPNQTTARKPGPL